MLQSLSGVRVIELAGLPPTSFSAMLLGDMGADVVRVTRPGPAGVSESEALGCGLLRSRAQSTCLDLKSAEGRERLLGLVADADVLIESNRPGVTERLGVGPRECAAVNSRLIYARLTGWGQTGPYAERPGHDINYIGVAGLLYPIGSPAEPPCPPLNLVGNLAGGALTTCLGIVAALYERETSGLGAVIDGAMVDGAVQLGAALHAARAKGTWVDRRHANTSDGAAPFYRAYLTSDARYVAVGAVEPKFFAALLELLDLPQAWADDQLDRELWPARSERFARIFATRSRAEWCANPRSVEACVTPVLAPAELEQDPHLLDRGALTRNSVGDAEPSSAPRLRRHAPAAV